MQPWQSILLIIITLVVFSFGFYYDQVKKNSDLALEYSFIESTANENDENNFSGTIKQVPLEGSSAWAETKIVLEVPTTNSNLIYLHKEALSGDVILSLLIQELDNSPTAKEMIFSPFLNEIFIEPEKEILRSLFSINHQPNLPNHLKITIRGHSLKSSSLLTKLIVETYKNSIEKEISSSPIHPDLAELKDTILELEKNQIQLAEQIQEENQNNNVKSIEEVAIRSELMQVSHDLKSHELALRDIEKIHRNKKEPKEFLTIHSLANFGNVQDIISKIEQLKTMLRNRPLEPIMENEVKKNLTSLEKSLYQELANGIIEIKKISQEAIKRKSELLKKLSDLEVKKNEIHSYHPSFKLLRAIKKQIDEKKSEFSARYQQWQKVKQGLIFKKAS